MNEPAVSRMRERLLPTADGRPPSPGATLFTHGAGIQDDWLGEFTTAAAGTGPT
ncbi:hypothetical protein [Streptomyces sp. NBC_01443]|uniref:hypothetical protein n=1 Tax=Streptomyces sp. NBC_01443 TaxID=2903868 RepID=UPI002250CD04|nr:hypothetical protein [Streptomyces sp. NBC_01443]MCX4631749.1 hypothetical protein [Streptomyces sp. NBC_01443]